MKKYINQVVEIIYMDRSGRITQRSIHIHAIRNGLVRATCLQTGAPRAFRAEQILALHPVKQSAKQSTKQSIMPSIKQPVKPFMKQPAKPTVQPTAQPLKQQITKGGSYYAS
ncbi:hypothetical protein [Paenibacillus woosongensis]|uniref:hypothetical protein n=1 Tax=Paenibacillus woosongensis TaxID=307580 RepID=UPI0039B6FAC6